MRKISVLVCGLIILIGYISILYIFGRTTLSQLFASLTPEKTAMAYAALPNSQEVLGTSITAKDGRTEAIRNVLLKYHSDLAGYADYIVSEADTYGIDYRLVPAIALHESGGCRVIPANSYNCWGLGVYGKQVMMFANYIDAINQVSKTLAEHYVSKGNTTPEDIMPVWDPASQGTWAKGVRFFLDQM